MKQCIIIRKDLGMSQGKTAVQAAHASVEAVLGSDKNKVKEWRKEGMKKIALKVDDIKELFRIKDEAKQFGLVTAIISDAGMTELSPGTVTCIAIGPDYEEKIDKVTGKLKPL